MLLNLICLYLIVGIGFGCFGLKTVYDAGRHLTVEPHTRPFVNMMFFTSFVLGWPIVLFVCFAKGWKV